MKNNYKVFTNPYVLVGDTKDKHQPFYKEYTKPPKLLLDSPMLCCPFQENKRFRTGPSKKTKKPGFCEVCYTRYTDYNQHIAEYGHRDFATDSSNFIKVDLFINSLEEDSENYFDSQLSSSFFDSNSGEMAYENILNISKVSTDSIEEDCGDLKAFVKSIKENKL